MSNRLFDLFGNKLAERSGLVASDPQSLDSLSSSEEEQELIVDTIADLESVKLKIDYSDFSNFVFFNSALDYFNITGEKILNEYPFGGSRDALNKFEIDLDGYQRHVLNQWPSYTGHFRFDTSISSSYIVIEDVGDDIEASSYRTGILSPGTGSISVELWINAASMLTGSNDIQILTQKISGSEGYSLYLTGSSIEFSITSGSITNTVSSDMSFGENKFISAVYDRSGFTGSLLLFTGSQGEFPVLASTSSIDIFGPINLGATSLSIASGTLLGKTTQFFTGSMDDLKIWKKVRSLSDLSSSFNSKQYSQKNLGLLYRFNYPDLDINNTIVVDSSGKGIDGRVINYYPSLRASGTLLIKESLDPVLNLDSLIVSTFINTQQTTAEAYDRSNENKITNLLPPGFFNFKEEIEADILKNFLYIYARNFDNIKQHIDQLVNVLHINYGEFNQTPDALLDMVAKFFGWEFSGNFLNADAFQYIFGKNVLSNVEANAELDTKLFEIKNSFWKRTLLNLIPMYKTKGTAESIKILLRSYGVNEKFVKIKEYGNTRDIGIQTNRISSVKSVNALGFGSGSLTGNIIVPFSNQITGSFTVEGMFKFPTETSSDITPTELSGTIFVIGTDSLSGSIALSYEKTSISSTTGTLLLSSSDGTNEIEIQNIPIFDNKWYHVSLVNNQLSSSLKLQVRHLDNNKISYLETSEILNVTGGLTSQPQTSFILGPNVGITSLGFDNDGVGVGFGFDGFGLDEFGNVGQRLVSSISDNTIMASEFWAQEVRYWDTAVSDIELTDHTLNFQSYGSNNINNDSDNLRLHLRLNESVTTSFDTTLKVEDISTNPISNLITASGFKVGEDPYKKFLLDYNYIAPITFGWNDDKIRIENSDKIDASSVVDDVNIISLEFNMIDSLNEDIVQTMSSLDSLNEAIGFPANKYRTEYNELLIMRHNYFKRLQGRLNFTIFADMLEFFDRTFIDMVKKLIPARALFIGDEFVVESHILERSKVTFERRKFQETELKLEGAIEMWTRFGRNADKSGATLPLFLTGSL